MPYFSEIILAKWHRTVWTCRLAKLAVLTVFFGLSLVAPRLVVASPVDLCSRHFAEAEKAYSVLPGLLEAVNCVESAWSGAPWPWTLNIDGKSYYFDSREEALAAMVDENGEIRATMAVGCMQIFVRYHRDIFESPAQMLDPRNNVHYGAWYLRKLYSEYGNWTLAVARYHAGAKNYDAQREYVCRVLHYQISLGRGALTDKVRRLCSGDFARYLKLAEIEKAGRSN